MYRIDMAAPGVTSVEFNTWTGVVTTTVVEPSFLPIPCDLVASERQPGKTLCVNEDGSSLVVEPDGSQVRTVPDGEDNWDSPWTQADLLGDMLVYRSSGGVPRAYRIVR